MIPDLSPVRREMPPAQWGVAAPCSSESFKTKSHKNKPPAKDWSHRLSPESTSRTGSSLKGAFKHLQNTDVISLGGGLPLSDFFPFETFTFTVPSAQSAETSQSTLNGNSNAIQSGKNDISDGRSVYDLSVALNYSQGSGSPQLLRWITEHTEIVHSPPYANWQCTMTIGSTSALDMALRMLTKSGHVVLSDKYTFATAVETASPMGVKFCGIEMDAQGMLPESLRETLDSWNPEQHGGASKPFLLYLIPTGQNPTGATQGIERRRAIYGVAQEHDLIILEDDPYYFLQMDPYAPSEGGLPSNEIHSPADLLKIIVPSYLSIDVDGRVLRMDSFSKVISPGSRIGWITAPEAITERYKSHADVSTQGPSGFSQLALFKLLDEHWGHAGYLEWLIHIRKEYTKRRDVMIRACERCLPADIVTWEPAQAGMFQWLRVDWKKHPDASFKSLMDIEEEIWHNAIEHGALVARGSWFTASKEDQCSETFYRATFAAAPLEKVEEAVKRSQKALKSLSTLPRTQLRSYTCTSFRLSQNDSTTPKDAAPLSSRWFSDLQARIGQLRSSDNAPECVKQAEELYQHTTENWIELLAGREGFITDKSWRGLDHYQLLWGDMGQCNRHVNNVMYNKYVETARVRFVRHHGEDAATAEQQKQWNALPTPQGLGLILKSIKTEFKLPLTFPDHITVLYKLSERPRYDSTSLLTEAWILSDQHRRLAARCIDDTAVYDYTTSKKSVLKPFMVEKFQETFDKQVESQAKCDEDARSVIAAVERLEGEFR
ncbi:hypothetical protein NM208_g3474 [Fusarium decemcellulare]|uniref:Uncharacterized protein n=1 Tax=Fusarium decemcellulare TaxID=57161 RepID=A0ACC1SPH1_9HYPO|nr:hypothetical protein NM208_g3474 [Fusarium decemcellulare]